MTKRKKEEPTGKESKESTFTCKLCGTSHPVGEMVIMNRFFPPLVACRSCERVMQ